MDNGQTVYKHATLTPSLPQPARKTNPLATEPGQEASQPRTVRLVGGQTTVSGNWSRKPNTHPYDSQPQSTRSRLITNSFPNCCSHFQFKANQRKPTTHHRLASPLPPPHPIRTPHLQPSLFFLRKAFRLLCLPLSFCQNVSDGGWFLRCSELRINNLCFFSFGRSLFHRLKPKKEKSSFYMHGREKKITTYYMTYL